MDATQKAEKILSRDVIELLIEYFSNANQDLKNACHDKLTSKEYKPSFFTQPSKKNISENKAKILAKDSNPYVRLELAKKGLCPEILKHDPVPQIRLYTLKNTGYYSEHYQSRERDPAVIREMLIQGVETGYYKSLNDPVVNSFIDEAEMYLQVIKDIESLNAEVTEGIIFLLKGLTPFSKVNSEQILSAIDYLEINLKNSEPSFIEKRKIDLIVEQNIEDILLQSEQILALESETRFGVVQEISADRRSVFIKGCNGHVTAYDTLELMQCMMDDHQAKKVSEENHGQKGFLNKKKISNS